MALGDNTFQFPASDTLPFPGNDDGAFIIRELTGDKRTISLTEHALPRRPLSIGGKHRVETTWYAGSPVATQQACGAEEEPLVCSGFWKTLFLERGEVEASGAGVGDVYTAQGMAELIDDVRVKGQTVEVTWNHLIRVGTISRFTQQWHTPDDVEWELTFDWQSKGQSARIASTRSSSAALPDISQEISGKMVDLDEATDPDVINTEIGVAMEPDLLERIDLAIGRAEDAVVELSRTVTTLGDGITAPIDSAQRAASLLALVEFEAGLVAEDMRVRVDRALQFVQRPTDLALIPPGRAIAASVAVTAATRRSRDLRHAAARRRMAVQREQLAQIEVAYRCASYEDLRSISTKFYGTPDDWQVIARDNGLIGSAVEAGQVVIVRLRQAVQ